MNASQAKVVLCCWVWCGAAIGVERGAAGATIEEAQWTVATPESQGMDAAQLEKMDADIEASMPYMRSIVVVRRGVPVFEKYYQGLSADDRHEVTSVTKSITSMLVGIALAEGKIKSLDETCGEYFPEYFEADATEVSKNITVRELLAMTPGYQWSDGGFRQWVASDNPVKRSVNLTVSGTPGERFFYTTPTSHILSAMVTKRTGQSALEFAKERLFKPLGITEVEWPADPQGITFGGHGLQLRMRDMAKLGQLYLQEGKWNGKQIVPAAWVKESTARHSDGGPPEREEYGYQWWVTKAAGDPAFFAGGYGGQYIYVVPKLELVFVSTANLDTQHRENRGLVATYVLPAVNK